MVCPGYTARQAGSRATKQARPTQLFWFAAYRGEFWVIDRFRVWTDCSSVLEFLPLRTGASGATYPSWFAPSFLYRKPLKHR